MLPHAIPLVLLGGGGMSCHGYVDLCTSCLLQRQAGQAEEYCTSPPLPSPTFKNFECPKLESSMLGTLTHSTCQLHL